LIYAEKKMKKRMEEFTGYKRGRLTVGTLPARGSYILPYVLKKFKEKYPGIDITIEEQNALILLKHILDETLDLCCFSLLEYPAEISYVLIKTENIFMVLPPDHPLGVSCAKGNFKMPVAFPEDKMRNLSNEDFILLPKSLAMGMTARRFFEVYNIKPNIFMVTRNVETSYRLAAAGIGIAFIPEKCIRFSSFDEQPYYFTVGNPPYQLSEVVAYKKGRILSKMEQYFIDLVKEIS
jgi:DNA-binding transcriptional LysR family regulator